MNNKSLILALLVVLPLMSCGKKSVKDEGAENSVTDKSKDEISFELNSDLKTALEKNDLNLFKDVLRKNPSIDLNKILNDGETLLTTVIKRDFRDFRNYLIEEGASVERANANKETPLIAAAMSRGVNSVRVLMDKDVDLNKKDASGLTALHHAIMMVDNEKLNGVQRKEFEDLAILLVKSGASVEITSPEDKNAYRLAVDHRSLPLQELIRTIMEIEYGTPDVGTFRTVLKTGDAKSLNLMLIRYPSMPLTYESINPLVLALEYNNEITSLRMLQLLLNYKAPINGPADAEVTPLIKAVKIQNKGFVVLLLDANANAQILDKEGKSPLYYAVMNKNSEISGILVREGALLKYPYKKDGVKFSFDACKLAREFERTAVAVEEKSKATELRKTLGCSSFSWLPF